MQLFLWMSSRYIDIFSNNIISRSYESSSGSFRKLFHPVYPIIGLPQPFSFVLRISTFSEHPDQIVSILPPSFCTAYIMNAAFHPWVNLNATHSLCTTHLPPLPLLFPPPEISLSHLAHALLSYPFRCILMWFPQCTPTPIQELSILPSTSSLCKQYPPAIFTFQFYMAQLTNFQRLTNCNGLHLDLELSCCGPDFVLLTVGSQRPDLSCDNLIRNSNPSSFAPCLLHGFQTVSHHWWSRTSIASPVSLTLLSA